ncbi:hypothetical protein [Deinococcus aquatilis]|uniref:hypothetical protein n=1 Tax=Deinococcus aquatilis TaxID=519440 RepID=UPI0012FA2CBE|nr:hypothetical protein [Deinococcus aquatilis]
MKQSFKPPLALLVPFILSACAPVLHTPLVTVVDGFTLAPGQRWEVTAQGGQGYSDAATFELVSVTKASNDSGFDYRTKRPDARVLYSDLVGPYPVYISAYWHSTGTKTKGATSSCDLRSPKLSSLNPPTFEGRWSISLKASNQYLLTGDTKGTGTCTIKLVQD